MGKYGGHIGKKGEPIFDLGHIGISLELNSGKIMADIWELPALGNMGNLGKKQSFLKDIHGRQISLSPIMI
jgi:hypothetical protein